MTGAIPRSLMTTSELRDLDADEQRDQLYLPTPAGVAYAGSHLGVPQPQPCNIFTGDSGEAAGESTGADLHRKAGSVPRETHRVDRGPTCSPAAPLRDENDTAPARGLVLGLVLGAAMWLCALALAADLGAFR